MGRRLLGAGERIGPRIWARYLKARFGCNALAQLNAQLALPIVPFENFVFGHEPAPLPLRLAPKFFESAYELGRSPDGTYWPEIHSPDGLLKFNLFERVSSRVPESSRWLLNDLSPYLGDVCPHIEASQTLVEDGLSEIGAFALSVPAVATLLLLDESGLGAAAVATVSLLLTPLPQCLALIHGLHHIAVWHSLHLGHTPAVDDLSAACADAACTFRNGLISLGLDEAAELGDELIAELRRGNHLISNDGARSTRSPRLPPPLEIGIRLVLVEDRPRARQAAKHLDALGQVVLERAYPYQVQNAFYSSGLTTTEAIEEVLMACADLTGQMSSLWEKELSRISSAEAGRIPAATDRHDRGNSDQATQPVFALLR